MRKYYWYLTTYIRKHGFKFLIAIIIGVAIFSFSIPYLIKTFSFQEKYYIGIVGEYNLYNLPSEITEQLSHGLIEIKEDGSFEPSLAEKLIIQENNKSYRFIFDENLKWQDGQSFSPKDINYTLPEAKITYEKNQITYELPEIFASFPQFLTKPLIRVEKYKKFNLFEIEKVYGLSNTILSSHQYNPNKKSLKQVVLDDLNTKKRYIYRFYFTQDQAVDGFKLGEVDYLIDVTNLEEIKSWHTNKVQDRQLMDQYLAVFFNHADPLMTKNLRLALNYAVEKEAPGYTRAVGPIPANSWAYFPAVKRYDKNIAAGVERLLDELPGEALEIELVTTPNYYQIANLIKKDWEELGVAAATACLENKEVKNKSQCEYLRLKVKLQIQSIPDTNDFQTMLIGQQIPADPDQYPLWHSNAATNFTHYKNTKVDNVLEKGRQTLSTTERITFYHEFQQALLDDPPAIFLWYLKSSDLARKTPECLTTFPWKYLLKQPNC